MFNSHPIFGRLTKDPELRYSQEGKAVTKFTVAGKTSRKDEEGNYLPCFYPCVAFQGQAETIANYFKQGDQIALFAEYRTRQYEDSEGQTKYSYDFVVQGFEFAAKKKQA